MTAIRKILFLALCVPLYAISCKEQADIAAPEQRNAMYFWKTTFDLNQEEKDFLSRHSIHRLYLRMFDVSLEGSNGGLCPPVPIATIKFGSALPDSIEIVPTVFITLDALKRCEGQEAEVAAKIINRVNAICSFNDISCVQEVQFDCDWTNSTRGIYFKLCDAARAILREQKMLLSGTIRLHQVEEAVYPFDKGVLMLYNTGAVKDPDTDNSIISFKDVSKYLGVDKRIRKFRDARRTNCQAVDFAYPTFSWGVVYRRDNTFCGLVDAFDFDSQEWLTKESDTKYTVNQDHSMGDSMFWEGQSIRREYSDIKEVLKVKALVDRTLRDGNSSNIIFHLDSNNLSKYSDNEIKTILR